MSTVELKFSDGQLSEMVIPDPRRVSLGDCRSPIGVERCPPFISVTIADDEVQATAYLPPKLARELYNQLETLFQEEKETI